MSLSIANMEGGAGNFKFFEFNGFRPVLMKIEQIEWKFQFPASPTQKKIDCKHYPKKAGGK
jgi:hypothetical protein